MAIDHHPVQNSEVYLLNSTHAPIIPPPSPPSPATPCGELSPPSDDLMSMTPPALSYSSPTLARRLATAVHVLSTEATALSHLTRLYECDPVARRGFHDAVEAITRFNGDKGKLVICGVGKSGHIAKKLVATMNSLKIHATYLHPTEALHGDLGKVGKHDTILLITFSGKTPELLSLLPHFDASLPLIVLTSHTSRSTCSIVNMRPDAILLSAPIHMSETDSFGVSAPTTSTTMALALGDALAMVISNELHLNVASVFSKNHPGGAIGAAFLSPKKVSDQAIPLIDIPEIRKDFSGAEVLMSAYRSKSGWVRYGQDTVLSPRRIKTLQPEDMDEPAVTIPGLMVGKQDWVTIPIETSVLDAQAMIEDERRTHSGSHRFRNDAILVLTDGEEMCSVLEIGDVSQL
ncbi:hypothetical protein B0O99DRAFT_50480 [Bisporella sp. PMI_857]|nr:hypothetical protein B0O99DRAFT_50480 [Bisporella sp. PMI_857]